jgi:hypothetical protein
MLFDKMDCINGGPEKHKTLSFKKTEVRLQDDGFDMQEMQPTQQTKGCNDFDTDMVRQAIVRHHCISDATDSNLFKLAQDYAFFGVSELNERAAAVDHDLRNDDYGETAMKQLGICMAALESLTGRLNAGPLCQENGTANARIICATEARKKAAKKLPRACQRAAKGLQRGSQRQRRKRSQNGKTKTKGHLRDQHEWQPGCAHRY